MRLFFGVCLLCFLTPGGMNAASPFPETFIPFEYSEGLLWVQLHVPQSARPLNFLFDTGASVSVVNSSTAKALGLGTGRKIAVQGVDTETTGHWPARMTASAGNIPLPAQYLALDLNRLAHSCGRPLDGLLGADFVRGRRIEIDFVSRQIRFLDEVSISKSDTVIPLERCRDCFCINIGVNGRQRQLVRLDTGCATALQWVTSNPVTCVKSEKPAIGLVSLTIPQAETEVSLGDRHFDRVPTGIHRRPIFAGEAGLFGNGLLARFKTVTIDAKANRLILGQLQAVN